MKWAFAASLSLHIAAIGLLQRPKPSPKTPEKPIITKVFLKGMSQSGEGAGENKELKKLSLPPETDGTAAQEASIEKLFKLTSSPTVSPSAIPGKTIRYENGVAQNSRTGSTDNDGMSGIGHGSVWYELQGDPEDRPLLDLLATFLHSNLSYPRDLFQLHQQGMVTGSMTFNKIDGFDSRKLRFKTREPFLGVHLIRELIEISKDHESKFRDLLNDDSDRSIQLKVIYDSGSHERFQSQPRPRVMKEQFEVTRNFFSKKKLDLGFGEISLAESSVGKALDFGFGFDLESLFSSKHRKRHGLGGGKQKLQHREALKIKYTNLLKRYREDGSLQI